MMHNLLVVSRIIWSAAYCFLWNQIQFFWGRPTGYQQLATGNFYKL